MIMAWNLEFVLTLLFELMKLPSKYASLKSITVTVVVSNSHDLSFLKKHNDELLRDTVCSKRFETILFFWSIKRNT